MDAREQLQKTLGATYTLERELGGGGMSRVFVAEETALRRKVVVKVLPPDLVAGVNVERFNREILVAAKLQHPHIVPVLSAGETNGSPYYTMPFVEGESLRVRLGTGTMMSITEVVGVLRDVAKALAYAHERGIVHRDIKPDNVLVTGGSATVTDFGIAKAISAARTHDGQATLTSIGTAIGTPAYMAPEQAAGDPRTDQRADIYAFGCMAYELLSGRPPFVERTPQRLLAAHMGAAPEPIASLRPDTPPELAALVTRCLAKEAEQRPQQATELVRVLETVTSGAKPAMSAVLVGGRRILARALIAYAGAFVVVALLAKAAVEGFGLPDWAFPAALVVMALGLPAILLTAYVQRVARVTATPTVTPRGSSSVQQGAMATMALKAGPHMSWRRTTLGGVSALAALVVATGVFMTMRAFGIGPAGSLFGKGSLAVKDRILVADFRAPAADSALGSVIAEGLRTSLGQSRAIGVVSAAGIADALRRMQKPSDAHLDLSLARELAEREGVKAVVHGEVASAGTGFIVTARLVVATTGAELASFRAAARDATDIIPAIDRLTHDLRARIGESLKSVRDAAPLVQVTTSSLPALRKYTEGINLHYRQARYREAAAAFEEAIRLDSTFGMAYARASNAYNIAATNIARRDSMRLLAYRMRDRLPPLERALVEGLYYDFVTRRDSSLAAYERALAIDSNQTYVLNILGNLYRGQRQPARAESLYRRAIALKDGAAQASGNVIMALVDQGKIPEAKAQIAAALREYPAYGATPLKESAGIAMAEGQYDSAQKFLERASSSERSREARAALSYRASLTLLRGRVGGFLHLRDSLSARDRASENVQSLERQAVGLILDSIHVQNWLLEQHASAASRLDAVVARLKPGDLAPNSILSIAREYAYAQRTDKAREMLQRFDREVKDSAQLRRGAAGFLEWAQGEIALAERRYGDAIAEFRASDRSYDGLPHGVPFFTDILLARAYDMAGMPDSAVVAFERYTSRSHSNRFTIDAEYLAGAFKRLGELYEAKGERRKAAQYYAKFVEVWKDADPELQPRVAEVRRRLARLSDVEARP